MVGFAAAGNNQASTNPSQIEGCDQVRISVLSAPQRVATLQLGDTNSQTDVTRIRYKALGINWRIQGIQLVLTHLNLERMLMSKEASAVAINP